MPRIYLVRHGEASLRGVMLGTANPPLSSRGHQQARTLAGQAGSIGPVRAIYSSPLRRALQTASYLLDPWVSLAVLSDLREISYGPWDGLTWEEVRALDPQLARRKADNWLDVDVPGAEPWKAFAERVSAATKHILRGPLPALVVAHQGVNAQIAHILSGSVPTAFHQDYCEVLSYAPHSN